MKEHILLLWETINNIYNNRRHFIHFFFYKKSKLIHTLKEHGFRKIRPSKINQWKLQYNICYFSANYINSAGQCSLVFIKVSGPTTKDCFDNEIVINKYIKDRSTYLLERSPELILSLVLDDFYILAFEYIDMSPINADDAAAVKEINRALYEFGECGLIHTDFGLVNVGYVKKSGKYCFFDYGTTLCPESNHVRIRNGKVYNHIGEKPDNINIVTTDMDFYYDDATHMKIPGLVPNGNYIAGGAKGYHVKMGSQIYKYDVRRKIGSAVEILHRVDLQ